MKVKTINWDSREDGEAGVIISDGINEIEAFSMPCLAVEGEEVLQPLTIGDIFALKRVANDSIEKIKPDARRFHYEIVGTVVNAKKGIVAVGRLLFDVSPLPGDIVDGGKISFFTDSVSI